ncbi:MAG TPA: hypothetical protein VHN11_03740, partial [Xanthobacteraceae bacterium]|nr:hypothetical protein [Xanthobacteraceae bacterium]
DHIAEKFRGFYLRFRIVRQLKTLGIPDEDVTVPNRNNNPPWSILVKAAKPRGTPPFCALAAGPEAHLKKHILLLVLAETGPAANLQLEPRVASRRF